MNTQHYNPASTPPLLPVGKILLGAFAVTWMNRQNLLRGLGAIALSIILVKVTWQYTYDQIPTAASMVFWMISMMLYAKFAVICHRLVLLEFGSASRIELPISWSDRETRFVGWLLAVYFLVSIGSILFVMFPFMIFSKYLPEAVRTNPNEMLPYAAVFVGIPATYLLARMSPIFPATALDTQKKLAWAWTITKANGFRLAIIVGLLPWLSGYLNFVLLGKQPGLPAIIISNILNYIFITIEITALSLAYRELTKAPIEEGISDL